MQPLRVLPLLFALFVINCSGTSSEPIPLAESNQGDADGAVELYDFESAGPWFECPEEFPEDIVTVDAFEQVHQYFGDEDRRTVEEKVDFPEGDWAQVGMIFQLQCPQGGVCDHWDRTGSVELILNPEATDAEEERVELLRHITPYRMGMCHFVDLTPLAGLLQGTKPVRSFIDTWVGPGHEQGEGWLVSARFVFAPGETSLPAEVVNVWNRRNITVGQIDPEENVASQIDAVTFSIPDDTTRVVAHLTTTGHSFGNTFNCAEFCIMHHNIIVNDTSFSVNPWRNDCAENPVSPQAGTWEHNRNGWCPGAVAVGHKVDITDAVTPGENELNFDILLANGLEYHNESPVDLLPYTVVALKLYVYD